MGFTARFQTVYLLSAQSHVGQENSATNQIGSRLHLTGKQFTLLTWTGTVKLIFVAVRRRASAAHFRMVLDLPHPRYGPRNTVTVTTGTLALLTGARFNILTSMGMAGRMFAAEEGRDLFAP
jgi:hypothetical protein